MSKSTEFEKLWQNKFSTAIEKHAGREVCEEIMMGCPSFDDLGSTDIVIQWSAAAMQRLDQAVSAPKAQAILLDCGCQYPAEAIAPIAAEYREHGDIDKVLDRLRGLFLQFLRNDLKLAEDKIATLMERGWGLAGKRDGDTIVATKIPKSANLAAYLDEADPGKRRRLYCHCPRVREALDLGVEISPTYCYCGGGFYRGIWEGILGHEVKVELMQSVLGGDEVCQFRVHVE